MENVYVHPRRREGDGPWPEWLGICPRYDNDHAAACALLFEAGVLVRWSDGTVSPGKGTWLDAYLLGTSLIFEGKLKIALWQSKRRDFRNTVREALEQLHPSDCVNGTDA